MDQSLSLPACPSLTPPDPAALPAAAAPTAAATAAAEDPDSPGRSPRPGTDLPAAATGETTSPDPLAEGLGLLAGMAIALITLVVPLAAVLCDPAAPPPSLPPRAAAL